MTSIASCGYWSSSPRTTSKSFRSRAGRAVPSPARYVKSLSCCGSFFDCSHRLHCTQALCSPVHRDASYRAIAHYSIAWGSTTLPILSAARGMRCYEKSICVSTSLSGALFKPVAKNRTGSKGRCTLVSLKVVDTEGLVYARITLPGVEAVVN